MKDPFRSDTRIGKVTVPLLMLHGERDGVVPIALGERLFALANEPKRFVRFAGGDSRRSRPVWRAGRGAVVHRLPPALNGLNALAPAMHASTKLVARAWGARSGGVRACRCAQTWESVAIQDRSVGCRRWVTPITASAVLLALTTGFLWIDRRAAAARPSDLHLFRSDRADRHPLRQHFRDVRDDRQHFRRGLISVRAALQFHGREPARSAGAHPVQPAGVAREPSGVRLRQGQRGREAPSAQARAASLRTRWPSMARAVESLGR